IWDGVLSHLDLRRTFRVVLWDLMGAFSTPSASYDFQRYASLCSHADDLLDVLHALGVAGGQAGKGEEAGDQAAGEAERETEGEAEGKAEGQAEGKAEGEAEGEAEGKAEGKADGKAEGEAEGKAEGEAEGEVEGKAEGEAEGVVCVGHSVSGMVALLASLEEPSAFKRLLLLGASPRYIHQRAIHAAVHCDF
ncbi:unnamed protein product, partial [Closterium sp. NIES-53]